MPIIKTVGIISKPGVRAAAMLVPELIEWLQQRGIAVRLDEHTGAYAGRAAACRARRCPKAAT